jgi:hypothetical protein
MPEALTRSKALARRVRNSRPIAVDLLPREEAHGTFLQGQRSELQVAHALIDREFPLVAKAPDCLT